MRLCIFTPVNADYEFKIKLFFWNFKNRQSGQNDTFSPDKQNFSAKYNILPKICETPLRYNGLMTRKTKFTKERIEIFLGLIKEGYSVTDSCRGIGVARSTYYKWTDEYPDLNKAVCEATDLQWKYGYDVLRRRKKRGYARQLNRPSSNYQSPGNMPFELPTIV